MLLGDWIKQKILSLIKIAIIIFIALFLPKIVLLYTKPSKKIYIPYYYEFKYGLENLNNKFLESLKHKNINPKIGLITNQTGIDQLGNRNIDFLIKKGFNITTILATENGINCNELSGKEIKNDRDASTKLPIIGIYKDGNFKHIEEEKLKNIDIMIFDIQDSGMRHYTYISTLYKILETAAKHNKKVIVLDRPNPLGYKMEGPLVEKDMISFISIAPIPVRHGLTIGELARYFNYNSLKKPADLIVIAMTGYQRYHGLTEKQFIPLSPNITNLDSCYAYSFMGLLGEIKPFNVCVGTPNAFQCILLPESLSFSSLKWEELKEILEKNGILSTKFRYKNLRENKYYKGLKIKIININELNGIKVLINILEFFKKNGIKLKFSKIFDKAIGTRLFREYFEGKIKKNKLEQKINNDLFSFYQKIQTCLIYKPNPIISKI